MNRELAFEPPGRGTLVSAVVEWRRNILPECTCTLQLATAIGSTRGASCPRTRQRIQIVQPISRFVFANGAAHDACRLFAAETSSLYKWKKRCSKQSWYGDAPLHLAVLNEHIDVAKYLLKVSTHHNHKPLCIIHDTHTTDFVSPTVSERR